MRKYIGLIGALFLCVTAWGQDRETLSLHDCIERGLYHNFQLQIVRNNEQAAHNNATAANAGLLPTIDLNAGYKPEIGSDQSELLNAGIALNWTLFDGMKMQTNYRQLRLLEQRGETDTRIAIEDLTADLASEYYNYLQQIIRRAHYRYALILSRERLRIAELNYQTGRFSGLDYHLAKVDFNADSAQYMKQRQTVHATRTRLHQMMGDSVVDMRFSVPDSSIVVRGDLMLETLWQQTLNTNASLLRVSQTKQIAELDYKKAISRNYPYLKLNAQYNYSDNLASQSSVERRQNLALAGGLTLGYTLFDGNRRRERKNANLAILNSDLQRRDLENTLRANLVTFWEAYNNNLQLLALQEQNLEIAESNLEIAMERYKLGEISGFDMRQVQKSLLDAEERVLQVQYDAKLCEISLLQISGNIGDLLK